MAAQWDRPCVAAAFRPHWTRPAGMPEAVTVPTTWRSAWNPAPYDRYRLLIRLGSQLARFAAPRGGPCVQVAPTPDGPCGWRTVGQFPSFIRAIYGPNPGNPYRGGMRATFAQYWRAEIASGRGWARKLARNTRRAS